MIYCYAKLPLHSSLSELPHDVVREQRRIVARRICCCLHLLEDGEQQAHLIALEIPLSRLQAVILLCPAMKEQDPCQEVDLFGLRHGQHGFPVTACARTSRTHQPSLVQQSGVGEC